MPDREALAHITGNDLVGWRTQSLLEHLEGVAARAYTFGEVFGSGGWAEYAGRLHDIGKYDDHWQDYLRYETGFDASRRGMRGAHSTAGAVWALAEMGRLGEPGFLKYALSYVVGGHHGGLPDWTTLADRLYLSNGEAVDTSSIDSLEPSRFEGRLRLDPVRLGAGHYYFHNGSSPDERWSSFQLWIRMLYSCVVDADSLDTEHFSDPGSASLRGRHESIGQLSARLDAYLNEKSASAAETPVNSVRQEVLAQCRSAAEWARGGGVFSLSVPTGGGKTLSAMSFALRHALRNGQKRVIVAIPYTSIIEQTAAVYKYGTTDPRNVRSGAELFGERNVIEHHSAFFVEEGDGEEYVAQRLATENWDAPIVVTTNVQLFESLYASRRSQCRKLHNIANSVIILDEAQTLPVEQFDPILRVMRHLVAAYNVTFVLATATQPALVGEIGRVGHAVNGLDGVQEIICNPNALREQLRRTDIVFPHMGTQSGGPGRPESWQDIADELVALSQVLCIVSTRQHCRSLHELMPEGTFHLSALMCAEDRSDRVAEIRQKLEAGECVRVVSTQVIEAGVDIDFPVVFRAMAGVDSIVQAAGRCNREGRMGELGRVVVFELPRGTRAPRGSLSRASDAARSVLSDSRLASNPDSAEAIERYFRRYYHDQSEFGKDEYAACFLSDAKSGHFLFKRFAGNFKLIDDTGQRTVVVRYRGEGGVSSDELITELETSVAFGGSPAVLLRRLQRYAVNIYEHQYQSLLSRGLIRIIDDTGVAVQSEGVPGLYIAGIGLNEDPGFDGLLV